MAQCRSMIITVLMALFTLTAALCLPVRAEGNLSISLLTKDRKVLPLLYRQGGLTTCHAKLPDIVITNNGSSPIRIGTVTITGRAKGKKAAEIIAGETLCSNLITGTVPSFNEKLNDPVDKYAIKVSFGDMLIPGGGFKADPLLKQDESTVIFLSQALYFCTVGTEVPESLDIRICAVREGREESAVLSLPLILYRNRHSYIFPLAGSVTLANMPMNLGHHRAALSQEFGFDVVVTGMEKSGRISSLRKDSGEALSDYFIYGMDIMAAADGTVVAVGDRFPESKMSNPIKHSSEDYFKSLARDLIPQIGFLNTLCGNYIIIDHGNGEFSASAHIKEGSIKVKPGDTVTKGQVIAQVGNTGHSSEPHLHFQLMDSKDFLHANGLPVMFENIPAKEAVYTINDANAIPFSDEFIYRMPEKR